MGNPIKYSDLISPDNSITDLIAQLTALISKYEEARLKIQTAAADMSKGLQNVSGATEQQRQAITQAYQETERLAEQYRRVTSEEQAARRQKIALSQAAREQTQIDKLVVQLNKSQEGSYNRLSAQYRLNKIRLNEMSSAQRAGTEAGRQLERETKAIYEQMSGLQKATGKYTLEVGHYENALRALPGPIASVINGLGQMREDLSSIGSADMPLAVKAFKGFSTIALGAVGIVSSFVGYLTNGVQKLREFEQANADLATILGVSVKDMKALTDSALSLGRTTEYTASQVTQLQTELAKLGFGQGSIISMQKYILQFATAMGASLGEAAEVAGSTLRTFNLTSADTEDALATLVLGANNSSLSFEKIRTSIGTLFPVANSFGLSLKDTTALIGALANAGFDASSAATATRNIILNLADANGKLAQKLGGSAKSFDEIFNGLIKLRKSGLDLAEALELTDKRSVAAFSAFLNGAESAQELRASLEDTSGVLETIEKERLNTVEGSTKLLQSAWEGLTLAFEKSNGTIKTTIDWLTKLVTQTQRLLFPTDTFVSESADKYTAEFQEYYRKNGAEAAKAYIDTFLKVWEKQASDTRYQADTKTGFLAKWLGIGNKQKAAKTAQNTLVGLRQAAETLNEQIENDRKESAKRQALEEEQARLEAGEKQKAETEKQKKARLKKEKEANAQRLKDLNAVKTSIENEIAVQTKGTDKILQLRKDKINAERAIELERNRQAAESAKQDEKAINAKYDKQILDAAELTAKEASDIKIKELQAAEQALQLQISITEDGTQEMLNLRLDLIEKQRALELEQNRQATEQERQDEKLINAKYDKLSLKTSADFNTKLAERDLKARRDLEESEFNLINKSERRKTIFRLKQEKERLEDILKLNETASEKLTDDEVAAIKNTIDKIKEEMSEVEYADLWDVFGINVSDKQKKHLNTLVNSVVDAAGSIIDSWKQAADAAVESAEKQVEAVQSVLDAEIEARNNGYANNVEQAQKELELSKKQQAAALREQEKAQKAQIALDTITQSSSLITASANLWASLSKVPIVGYALAIAAIATMWGSFAAAKVKAVQVAGIHKSEKYGEGTIELLQGGSHASGNDIDMGTKKDGTRRRAEGGEYFAIINKRNSRKYRNVIPDVIKSFNDGSFADKYQKANEQMSGYALNFVGGGTDVTQLQKDVRAIKEQGREVRYVDAQGNVIVKYKNLTRRIKS